MMKIKTQLKAILKTVIFVSVLAGGVSAVAQMADPMDGTLRQAVAAYEGGNYREAALKFYDVYLGATTPPTFQTAEFYLGRSLLKMDLYLPALNYLGSVINAGASHKFFLQAAEAMVELKEKLNDDNFVPHYLDQFYSPDFGQIPPETLHKINYIVGSYQYRRNQDETATQFLSVVPQESIEFSRAQYLLGMIAFRHQQVEQAQEYFQKANEAAKGKMDPKQVRIYWLSTMALARTAYQLGDFEKADALYGAVPRFTEDWLDSLFEQAWTFFQRNELGRALGNVHTLKAPQFSQLYWPEAWLLAATAYYYSCNYGLAEREMKVFDEKYNPMLQQIEKFMAVPQANYAVYYNLIATEWQPNSPIPKDIHNYIAKNARFKRFKYIVNRLQAEKAKIQGDKMVGGSRLGNEIMGALTNMEQQITGISGRFVVQRLKFVAETLQDFANQAMLIKFEIQKSQAISIQTGKEQALNVIKDEAPHPRPKMKADEKYYEFNGEFWVDELGYYVYTLSMNCPEEE